MSALKLSSLGLVAVILLLCTGRTLSERKRYDWYRVIRVDASHPKIGQINTIIGTYSLDVWRHPSPAIPSYDVMVSPNVWDGVTEILNDAGVKYTTIIPNVQHLIDNESKKKKGGRSRRHSRRFQLQRYHTLEEIRRWMHNFARANRDIVKLLQVGVSYEGRRILALKIGVPQADTNITKRIIWQDAGIHAREWVTTATLIWLSRKLVKDYRGGDPVITEYLEQLDWYIIPIWNVDGYKYTWNEDRMWRKSRSDGGSFNCYGVDLNRNFLTPSRGAGFSSDNPCSEVYHGTKAFSEIESSSVRRYMLAKRSQLAAVLTLHSYSQYWLFPYGYTLHVTEDHDELQNLSIKVVNAMQKKYGTVYKQGTVSRLAYRVTGGSIDWSYRVLCVKHTFAVELRDTGNHGFILPPSLIIPTAEEYYDGLEVVVRRVMDAPQNELQSKFCSKRSDL